MLWLNTPLQCWTEVQNTFAWFSIFQRRKFSLLTLRIMCFVHCLYQAEEIISISRLLRFLRMNVGLIKPFLYLSLFSVSIKIILFSFILLNAELHQRTDFQTLNYSRDKTSFTADYYPSYTCLTILLMGCTSAHLMIYNFYFLHCLVWFCHQGDNSLMTVGLTPLPSQGPGPWARTGIWQDGRSHGSHIVPLPTSPHPGIKPLAGKCQDIVWLQSPIFLVITKWYEVVRDKLSSNPSPATRF